MINSKLTALVAGLSFITVLSACSQQSDKDKLMEAQMCLDKANSSTAQSCVAGIASLQSSLSYALQCSAGFIQSGVSTPEKLSVALDSINSNNGSSGSTTLLSVLNMGDETLATNTADFCAKSGQVGFSLLGAMAKSATVLASAATSVSLPSCNSITDCDGDDMKDIIDKISTDLTAGGSAQTSAETVVTKVAESIQTIYATTCGTGSANEDLCKPIEKALQDAQIDKNFTSLTSAELLELGKQLLSQWKP